MKKALIDPNSTVILLTEWVLNPTTNKYSPVYTAIPNSNRVSEVEDVEFEVCLPLFWVDCADDVVADIWYYDAAIGQILVVPPPAPHPSPDVNGAETL
jgi:hypothetical protein